MFIAKKGKSEHLSQLVDKFILIDKDIVEKGVIAEKEESWLF